VNARFPSPIGVMLLTDLKRPQSIRPDREREQVIELLVRGNAHIVWEFIGTHDEYIREY